MLCLLITLLAACGSAERADDAGKPTGAQTVVVASFDFSESQLVAEIYAQALERAGVPVKRELALGSRELVQPAMRQGLVDVVPEYLGSALTSLYGAGPLPRGVDPQRADQMRVVLARQLSSWHFEVLDPAPAQDQNVVVVTRARARSENLHAISDLARRAGLILGAPAECATREYCLPGLERVYGLRGTRLLTFPTEGQRASALAQGVVDAAVMFSTDGRLASSTVTVLADDRHLQPVENIVPLVSERVAHRYGTRLTDVLNAVSAKLTDNTLRFLNWRVDVAGNPIRAEASAWVAREYPAG